MADALKAKGNAAFQAGNFDEAIKHFSDAIALDGSNHVLYSNRSASHASQQRFDEALADAQKVVELKPDWAKGHARVGAAHMGLRNWDDAIEAYKKSVELDPTNEGNKEALSSAEKSKAAASKPSGASGLFTSPEALGRLYANPTTRAYMQQPDFMAMLQALNTNPQLMTAYLNDERFQTALQVALGMNIMSGDQFRAQTAAEQSPSEGADTSTPLKTEEAQPAEAEPEPMETGGDQDERQKKEAAMKEKDLGNAAYKAKNFDEAIQHYTKAYELYDEDVSPLTNRAAARFEQGDYDKCIEDCDTAVDRARELRADYKVIARALTRKGNALAKKDDLEGAVDVYNKALMEHRNPDTLKRLQDTEKKLKERNEQAYIDLDKSNEEREKGNEAFKAQNYPDAVQHYTEALKRGPAAVNPEAYKLYSNRAACYTKLGAWNDGLKDAEECIKLNPDFAKGYSRKGHLQFFMKEYDKALETYEEGLKHDPSNEELKEGGRRCIEAISKFSRGEVTEEELKARQQRAMADPEVQNILIDPVMRQVLQDFQENPKDAQKHMKNPGIMTKLNKLVQAGIVQLK